MDAIRPFIDLGAALGFIALMFWLWLRLRRARQEVFGDPRGRYRKRREDDGSDTWHGHDDGYGDSAGDGGDGGGDGGGD